MPVDIYVPGCPPRPEDLIDAVMQIQKLIGDETVSAARMAKREAVSQGTLG
jgi:NADH-quinone oxidoreductase subunit B